MKVLLVFHYIIIIIYLRILSQQGDVERTSIQVQWDLGLYSNSAWWFGHIFHFSRPVAPHLKVGITFSDLRYAWKVKLNCSYQPKFVPQVDRWLWPAWNTRPVCLESDLAPRPRLMLLMLDRVPNQERSLPSCAQPFTLHEKDRDVIQRLRHLHKVTGCYLNWSLPLPTSLIHHFCTPTSPLGQRTSPSLSVYEGRQWAGQKWC